MSIVSKNYRHVLLRSMFLLVGLFWFSAFSEADELRPNIVFIMADDLGYGDLSCFGQQHFTTPRLDQLAKSGLRLTQHYSGSTVCAPSRCVLMTGLHTGHCFVRGNKEHFPVGQAPIPDNTITLAEILKTAGYKTGMFGKWGLGYPGSVGDPMNQGFDEFYGYNCQRNAHRYYPKFLWHNRDRVELDGQTYAHELIMQQALDFIKQHKSEPFFCYVPVSIPHAAMELPEAIKKPFREKFSQFEDVQGEYAGAEYTNPIASFAAMVTQLDGDVGRIIDLLRELGIERNTLVIFTSDNGPHREGGHDPDFFQSSGGYRGVKRDLYEGGIRVPTIVSWPGTIEQGRESDHLSAFWDWLPTFCELASIESEGSSVDGLSLVPTLFGETGQQKHDELYWEFHEFGGKQAIRVGDWKAIRLDVGKNPDGPLELYDLAKDPHETTNVADQNPKLVEELATRMAKARTPSEQFHFKSGTFKP